MPLPSLRRKLPTSSVLWFFAAAACALVAFAIVRGQAARAAQAQRAVGPLIAVARAAHDLTAGDVVSFADVRIDEMPTVFAPPGSVGSAEGAVGRVVVGPVATGEVLVASRLASSAYATSVAPGNVAVTVGFTSVPAGFSPADRVDAYATYSGARPYTTLVGTDIHVLAIGDGSASVGGPTTVAVTLDVDPEIARQLFQASVGGALGLALHPAVTASPSPSSSASAGWSASPG